LGTCQGRIARDQGVPQEGPRAMKPGIGPWCWGEMHNERKGGLPGGYETTGSKLKKEPLNSTAPKLHKLNEGKARTYESIASNNNNRNRRLRGREFRRETAVRSKWRHLGERKKTPICERTGFHLKKNAT